MEEWILITGANSEIGMEIANKYLEKGEKVILTDIISEIEDLTYKVNCENEKNLKRIKIYELDLENFEGIIEFAKLIRENYKVKALINVAGINILREFFSWSVDELRKVIDINFLGATLLTQKITESMILNKIKGNIIFISSQHGLVANYNRVAYCVSKGMIIQLTKALALELSGYGIRVNCISPTYVLTDKNRNILNSANFLNDELSNIPLGSYLKATDIAKCIDILDDIKMMTGQNIVIDGGWTIK